MARLGYPTDVDELLDDPWDCKSGEPPPKGPRRVSSLTLDEFAANCPYGEDPDDAGMRNNLARAPFGVHNLVDMCQSMTEWSGRVFYDETPTSAWQDIMELWRKAGIAQIASGNFFAVSIAATRRECKWSEDRIYGIQQLFQLRLGNTVVGKAGQQFTQDQLQDTLTITLLKTHSALSQIHVLTAPVAPEHAWKMNESSVFPRMTPERFFRIWSSKETLGGATGSSRALNMRRKENEREDSYIRSKGYTDRLTEYSCQFDVINIAGTTWARFKGYTTPFSRFIPRCYEEARSLPEDVLEVRRATTGLPPKGFSFKVFLDASNEPLPGVDPDLLIDHYDNIYEAYGLRGINGGGYYLRSGSLARQVKLAEQLSVSFVDPDDLVVLEMLTTFGDPFWSDYGQYIYLTDDCYWSTYGLLLQRKAGRGGQHHRRLGYCYWEDYHVRKRRERAKLDEWSLCDGIFG